MPKERVQVTPATDLSSGEAIARFVVDLNTRLDKISERLPSLTQQSIPELRGFQQTISAITNRTSTAIPDVIENPVDLNALKVDLKSNTMPAIIAELVALKKAQSDLAIILSKLINTLTD